MQTQVTMVMALTRPQRYELALAKCAELGALYEFIPIVSERVQRSDSTIGNPTEGLVGIASSSRPPSCPGGFRYRGSPLRYLWVHALDQLTLANTSVIFLWEQTPEPMLTDLLASFRDQANGSTEIAFAFGPVGGFSNEEAERAVASGAQLASLGPRILRTETAAIASMAVAAQVLS